jgi:hypothetical protein
MSESTVQDVSMAELRALLADLLHSQQDTDRRMKETDRRQKETDRQLKETDRHLKELGRQIGGLGNKLGSFTEGLALPSMEKILRERFGMEVVSPSVRVSKCGEHLELDVLAYANGDINAAYVVEVKSHLREESIDQLLDILRRFGRFFPEHKDKKLYGILAAVDIPKDLKAKVMRQGLYLARIHDDVFELETPEGFQGKSFTGA